MEFSKGQSRPSALQVVGDTTKRGTKITFWPDDAIMNVTEFDYDILAKRLRELAFLNKGINIYFRDERNEEKDDVNFCYEGGLVSFVSYLNENKEPLFPHPIYFQGRAREMMARSNLKWPCSGMMATPKRSIPMSITSPHAMAVPTYRFLDSLTRVLNNYIKSNNLLKTDKICHLRRRHARRA